MITEVIKIAIDGEAADDLVLDAVQLEVEEDLEQADVFRLRLAISTRADGSWTYVDDRRFQVWRRFALEAGYPGATEALIDGYVTHVDLMVAGDGDSYLEISGMDRSAVMDLSEKQLAWSGKKDHEIAREIFESHGLGYEVEDTVATHDEAVSTVLQTETDIRFLRRLAARNGFECYVRGGTGYFRSPDLQTPPQKTLAIEFGEETNLVRLGVKVDGTPATVADIRRIDPIEKAEVRETLEESPRRALGEQSLGALRSGVADGRRLVRREPAVSEPEMQGRLRRAYEGASRFVTAEGEVDGRAYRAILRPRRLVTVKGIGETYSGLYYVGRVRHVFTLDSYTQQFEAWRNDLGLTGDEPFATPALPVAITPAPADAGAAGNRILPAQPAGASVGGV